MHLLYRSITPPDYAQFLEMMPPGFPGTQKEWARLPEFWNTITRPSGSASLVEDQTGTPQARVQSWGMTAFVTPAFAQEIKTSLPPYIGWQMFQRWLANASPILSAEQVRDANSREGLHLVIHFAGHRPELPPDLEAFYRVGSQQMAAFFNNHLGYRLQEFLMECLHPEMMPFLMNAGMKQHTHSGRPDPNVIPSLLRMNREDAMDGFGGAATNLFVYQAPRLFFSEREQETLRCALNGETDEEMAHTLNLSLSAVQKRWTVIYDRVAAAASELIMDRHEEDWGMKRGAEKRRHILAYLRSHPEEMRPLDRKVFAAW